MRKRMAGDDSGQCLTDVFLCTLAEMSRGNPLGRWLVGMAQVKEAAPTTEVMGGTSTPAVKRQLKGSEQNAALAILINKCRSAVGTARTEMKNVRQLFPTRTDAGVKIVLTPVQKVDRAEMVAKIAGARVRAVEAACDEILAFGGEYPSAHVGRRDLTSDPDDSNSVRVGPTAAVQWFRGELKAVLA